MLYRQALGPSFGALPNALQTFHSIDRPVSFEGDADVTQGNATARLAVRMAGFPVKAGRMPIRLTVTPQGAAELWERSFDGHITRSLQWLHGPGVIAEKVGMITLLMRPEVADGALSMPIVGLRGLTVPLPGFTISGGGVERIGPDEEILFDVRARALILGDMIAYRGALRHA